MSYDDDLTPEDIRRLLEPSEDDLALLALSGEIESKEPPTYRRILTSARRAPKIRGESITLELIIDMADTREAQQQAIDDIDLALATNPPRAVRAVLHGYRQRAVRQWKLDPIRRPQP